MSLFNRVFKTRDLTVIKSAIFDAREAIFVLYGVAHPTDAQKVKATVYLCIAVIAMLNDLGLSKATDFIDRIAKESARLTESLRMRIRELANDNAELDHILAAFPTRLAPSTIINGLGAFEALYKAKVKDVVDDILNHPKGPMGTIGSATLAVTIGLFGVSESNRLAKHFIPAIFELNKMIDRIIKMA